MAKSYRVGIIGRTGRGGYGHNLHLAWKTHPRAQVVGLADDNPEGLKKTSELLGVRAAYADYHEMLRQERPEIAVVAPRWVDCHLEMLLAAAEVRASVFMEKPVARTPADADRMIAACDGAGVKFSVAHNLRVCPILDVAQQRVKEGLIGQLLEIRGRGKEDKRAGGEDMMVLGTHVFEMMMRFAGEPLWASGRVTAGGQEIRRKDVTLEGPEGLGPIAGDAIAGMFGFSGGVTGYFASKRGDEASGVRFGLDLYGSRGVVAIRAAHVPDVFLCPSVKWTEAPWSRLDIPAGTPPRDERQAYHLMIDDFLEAIEQNREPRASGRLARWTIEMAMSLYESQMTGGRVCFPLQRRDHPLTR